MGKRIFKINIGLKSQIVFYTEKELKKYVKQYPEGWFQAQDIEVINVLTNKEFDDIMKGD